MQVSTRRLAMLALASLFLVSQPAAADNWPRFRGPNGTGIAHDRDIPIQWTDENILWKIKIPGRGHSSPIVWGDRLFVQTASSDSKQRLLLCIDVKDGRTVWSRSIPGVFAKTHPNNNLASQTPATDGERVYAAFWDGKNIHMAAYDFQGNQVWTRDLGPYKSQHGAGHSPVVVGNKVILNNDQDDFARLVALDARTGHIAWQQDRPAFRACYAAPFVLEKPGQSADLVVVSTMAISGYDPDTGNKRWNYKWKFHTQKPQRVTGSPIVVQDLLFACAGDGGGDRHMIAVNLNGTGGSLVWENLKDFPYVPTLLSRGEHLYFVNDLGMAGCYQARDGKRLWLERLPGAKFMSSPVLIDGKIYACSEQGDVFVINAAPTFELLARNSLGEVIRATPAVSNNRLYIRGAEHLFCIGQKK